MKKLFILLMMASFFGNCEKDILQTPDSITKVVETRAAEPWWKKLKAKVKLVIDSGTRKTAKRNEAHDLLWGTDLSDGTKCQGRSMCLFPKKTNAGGGDDGELIGHATFAEQHFVPFDTRYAFTLGTDLEGGFLYSVHPDDITSEQREIVFEGGAFVMDADYAFTEEVTTELGVDSCVLPAGTYEVTEDEEGRMSFEFYN